MALVTFVCVDEHFVCTSFIQCTSCNFLGLICTCTPHFLGTNTRPHLLSLHSLSSHLLSSFVIIHYVGHSSFVFFFSCTSVNHDSEVYATGRMCVGKSIFLSSISSLIGLDHLEISSMAVTCILKSSYNARCLQCGWHPLHGFCL